MPFFLGKIYFIFSILNFYKIFKMILSEKDYGVKYEVGYSDYTFELWMLLYVADMKAAVSSRTAYFK